MAALEAKTVEQAEADYGRSCEHKPMIMRGLCEYCGERDYQFTLTDGRFSLLCGLCFFSALSESTRTAWYV